MLAVLTMLLPGLWQVNAGAKIKGEWSRLDYMTKEEYGRWGLLRFGLLRFERRRQRAGRRGAPCGAAAHPAKRPLLCQSSLCCLACYQKQWGRL